MATVPIRRDQPRRERLLSEIIEERRATHSFDGSPVPDEDLRRILDAGTKAPSGYNLQPWRFVVVRSAEGKKKLRAAAMGQPKVEEAGAVIVACGDIHAVRPEQLDRMLKMSEEHGFAKDQNERTKQIVTGTFSSQAGDAMGVAPDFSVWLNRHVMIAFTTMMWMAEALGYDTAPMEGFFESKVKQTLEIPEHVRVVALLGIGHRKGEDKKFAGRLPLQDLAFEEWWGNRIRT
jgi:nitroreductase